MTIKRQDAEILNFVHQLTQGRPYAFVVMDYQRDFTLYECMRSTIEQKVGLKCIRADEVRDGQDVPAKIHLLIEGSEVVIGEISCCKENVYYEIGYADGLGKPLLLLTRQGCDVPFNLKTRSMIYYEAGTRIGAESLNQELCDHLLARLNLQTPLLREMLQGNLPEPVYIVAYPFTGHSQYAPRTEDVLETERFAFGRRTVGDNIGIRGLLSAFGSLLGASAHVDLVQARRQHTGYLKEHANLFLIGSQRVNPSTKTVLQQIQEGKEPRWRFGPPTGEPEEGDWKVILYKEEKGAETGYCFESRIEEGELGAQRLTDYGLIVRAPHPLNPRHIVMILAGPRSLGTGAACFVATQAHMIREIKQRLPLAFMDPAGAKPPFWVLVKGEALFKPGTGCHADKVDMDRVTIVDAGMFQANS